MYSRHLALPVAVSAQRYQRNSSRIRRGDQPVMSKREAKREEVRASNIISSFAQTVDASFQAEIDYILGELQNNRQLTYALGGMLKNDSLVALLDGRLQAPDPATAPSKKNLKIASKLRATATRFKHVSDTKGCASQVLQTIVPELWTAGLMSEPDNVQLDLLCVLLCVTPDTHLPSKYWVDLHELDNFVPACSQRFAAVMSETVKGMSLEELKKGYYTDGPNGGVQCIFSNGLGKTDTTQEFGDKPVTIENPLDVDTPVSIDMEDGRKMKFYDLKASFEAAGVRFPVPLRIISFQSRLLNPSPHRRV